KALAWTGAIAIAMVMLYAMAHVTVTTGSTPAPTPLPTPTPAPDPFAPARWAVANVAGISLLLAVGIRLPSWLSPPGPRGSRHPMADGRAPLNHPLAMRYWNVRELEARRGWLPESFTYSPHMRNDVIDAEPAPPPPPHIPTLSLEDLMRSPGVTYGVD